MSSSNSRTQMRRIPRVRRVAQLRLLVGKQVDIKYLDKYRQRRTLTVTVLGVAIPLNGFLAPQLVFREPRGMTRCLSTSAIIEAHEHVPTAVPDDAGTP